MIVSRIGFPLLLLQPCFVVAPTAGADPIIVFGLDLLLGAQVSAGLRKGSAGLVEVAARYGTAAAIEATLQQLSEDAHHSSLRTHKLRGSLAGC